MAESNTMFKAIILQLKINKIKKKNKVDPMYRRRKVIKKNYS